MLMKRLLPLLVLIGSALPAMAHPVGNHATPENPLSVGFLHPLTGLDHLLVMVAVGLWAVQLGGRTLWMLPLSFVGFMTLGCIIGLLGLHSPMVEPGILASLILLGVALGMAWKPGTVTAIACVAAAGFCHGAAHGMEIPSGMTPMLFLAGMIVCTSLLHVLGISVGCALKQSRIHSTIRIAGALLLAFAAYDLAILI